MALALIKIKIMPDSPSANLDEIEKKAIEIIKKSGSQNTRTEKEPIAFGLTAIILTLGMDEEKSSDELVDKLRKIKHVSSAEIIDFRRAIG